VTKTFNFAKWDHCRKCNNPKGNTHSFGTDQWQVEGFGHAQLEIDIKKGIGFVLLVKTQIFLEMPYVANVVLRK